MKKFIAILLTVMLLLSLAACGGGDKPADSGTGGGQQQQQQQQEQQGSQEQSGSQGGSAEVKPATDGTLELSTANLAIVINGKTVSMPYDLDDIYAAGIPASEAIQEIELAPTDYFIPNIFIDEAEDYLISPTYYNGSDRTISISEAEAQEIGIYTYADAPEDQNISILGIGFATTQAEIKALLGEPMWDDGDIWQWLVTVSDAELEGNFHIAFTSDAEDAPISMVNLSVTESW